MIIFLSVAGVFVLGKHGIQSWGLGGILRELRSPLPRNQQDISGEAAWLSSPTA